METTQVVKSFWDKPGGKVGTILAVLIGIGGLVFFYKHSDQIIHMMENAYYAAAMIAGAILLYSLRTVLWYAYKGLVRGITGIFIELNPISILKGYVEDLMSKMKKMDEQIRLLKGQMSSVRQRIQDKKDEMEKSINYATACKKKVASDPREEANVKLH